MKNKELLILWGIIIVTIIAFISVFALYDPQIKQNQRIIDNLKNAKSIDLYLSYNDISFGEESTKITNINGDISNSILEVMGRATATNYKDFNPYYLDNEDVNYKYRNIYCLEVKDKNNNTVSKYYIYDENHLKQDDYVITLDNQDYNELTSLITKVVSKSTGTLNCNTDNVEDSYLVVNSVIKKYRNITYDSIENFEPVRSSVMSYQQKYEGYETALKLKDNSYGSAQDVYSVDATEDTMAIVKKYYFDILSEEAINELLSANKDEFINRTFEEIKNNYPVGTCQYSIW